MSLEARVNDLPFVHEEKEAGGSHANLREKTHTEVHAVDVRHWLDSLESSEPFVKQVCAYPGVPLLIHPQYFVHDFR